MSFKIDTLKLEWIDGNQDNPEDFCLHGQVRLIIGEEIIDDGKEKWTLSVGAYRMLKSLYYNHLTHIDGLTENYFLTCCGFQMIILENELYFMDCPSGINWTVLHEGNMVKLTTISGKETIIPREEYKAAVFAFADEIKAFYDRCSSKTAMTTLTRQRKFLGRSWYTKPKSVEDKDAKLAHDRFWHDWNCWRNEET